MFPSPLLLSDTNGLANVGVLAGNITTNLRCAAFFTVTLLKKTKGHTHMNENLYCRLSADSMFSEYARQKMKASRRKAVEHQEDVLALF
ncbi:MAG: hypothetical protein IJU37_06805 [Desulfovibrio sp.]|nr:hypothetical protein [Desulfovibrio sp.]